MMALTAPEKEVAPSKESSSEFGSVSKREEQH